MNKPENFNIYIPSYGRADTITTHKLLEYYTVVVRESQREDYLQSIPAENILAVPDEEINSVCKVWNWLIDNAPEDYICLIGDDVPCFYYRLDRSEKLTDPEIITSEIERIAQIQMDLAGCDSGDDAFDNFSCI